VGQIHNLSIKEYNYSLNDQRIAKYPLENRDGSKLLIFNNGKISEDKFSNIDSYLPVNSKLFCNNTRVIHARLRFQKQTGAAIEVFCLSPLDPIDYQMSFSQVESCTWNCLVGNLKKWKSEELLLLTTIDGNQIVLKAEKISSDNENINIRFTWNGGISFGKLLDHIGQIPIPPYLNRKPEIIDESRYQTIYSKYNGSVAAPTAGLHFTPSVFEKLSQKGFTLYEVTLHVGAGTFQPMKAENIRSHKMHKEYFSVSMDTIKMLAENKTPIISIGTTTLRALESLYWLSVKSIEENRLVTNLDQWEYYKLKPEIPVHTAFYGLLEFMAKKKMQTFLADTSIMIVPGYQFKIVKGLITNFHQPQSTLLLLVAAFTGTKWKEIYQHALDHNFRFLSYGDSSLLLH
jgi:S-adenosylmethionine:tRNA ribosyltransferase-isomerase